MNRVPLPSSNGSGIDSATDFNWPGSNRRGSNPTMAYRCCYRPSLHPHIESSSILRTLKTTSSEMRSPEVQPPSLLRPHGLLPVGIASHSDGSKQHRTDGTITYLPGLGSRAFPRRRAIRPLIHKLMLGPQTTNHSNYPFGTCQDLFLGSFPRETQTNGTLDDRLAESHGLEYVRRLA